MFDEYEESFEWFLELLSTTDPDKFTAHDWDLIRSYTHSDGCTDAPDWLVQSCWEHDFYFRTHHDFSGKFITFCQANARFLRRMIRLSWFGPLSLRAYFRWAIVSLLGKNAWHGRKKYRGNI